MVKQYFGSQGITGYTEPIKTATYPHAIMRLANTNTAGRKAWRKSEGNKEIIGEVINHGKRKYWTESGWHYHASLQKGENTLEGHLARLTIRHFSAGAWDIDRWRKEYVKFMTAEGSHNDCYASSVHRLFFERQQAGIPLNEIPTPDFHDVDQIDGLIYPTVTLLANLPNSKESEARSIAKEAVTCTRISKACQEHLDYLSPILNDVLSGTSLRDSVQKVAKKIYGKEMNLEQRDPTVSCYLEQSFPALLHFAAKYDTKFEEALLANANVGGENVHRGIILGALLGAAAGDENIPNKLKEGLYFHDEIEKEIDDFVARNVHGK